MSWSPLLMSLSHSFQTSQIQWYTNICYIFFLLFYNFLLTYIAPVSLFLQTTTATTTPLVILLTIHVRCLHLPIKVHLDNRPTTMAGLPLHAPFVVVPMSTTKREATKVKVSWTKPEMPKTMRKCKKCCRPTKEK